MADSDNIKETVREVLDGRREFTFETVEGGIIHCYIANPSGEDVRKADWQYSKVYNQAIVDGFLTQAQMLELLKSKGIITEEYSYRLETVRISLGAELFKLENLMENATEEEQEISALEVSRLRDELFQLNQRVNGPMANTCENLAEDARTDFLTSRVIQNKDGSRKWDSYEAYRNEENTGLTIKSRFEVMLWLQGLESNFLENTPEQTTLRKIAQARLERAVAKEAEESELESNEASVEELKLPEVAEEKKPTKRRGRPRTKKTADKPRPKPKAKGD